MNVNKFWEQHQKMEREAQQQRCLRAIAECVKMAAEKERVCYLYKPDGKGFYRLSYECWGDYLFKAYPGGRKQLTAAGVAHLEERGVDVKKATAIKEREA